MPVKIRPMTDADKPAVMKMLHATPEFKPFEVAIAEELIDCYLQDHHESGYHILVAEVDSAPVGYICYGPNPLTEGTWDMYWQAVVRDRQGQGIGKALTEGAETEIRKALGRLVIIETSSTPAYEKTRRFHIHNGYEVIGRIPEFYAAGDDKVILYKRLN